MSTRAEWAVAVRTALSAATDAMSLAIGARVRVEYDEGADTVLPRFVSPARLEDYYSENDRQRVRKLGLNAARDVATEVIRRTWKHCRDESPTLWSFELWHEQCLRVAGGTSELSSDAFAEHMKARRG